MLFATVKYMADLPELSLNIAKQDSSAKVTVVSTRRSKLRAPTQSKVGVLAEGTFPLKDREQEMCARTTTPRNIAGSGGANSSRRVLRFEVSASSYGKNFSRSSFTSENGQFMITKAARDISVQTHPAR